MFIKRDKLQKRRCRMQDAGCRIKTSGIWHLASGIQLVGIITLLILFFFTHNVNAARIVETSAPSLIVMPDDGIKPLERIVSDAGKSLDIIMHRLSDKRILQAISRTARRGVKVRVLLEKNPTGMNGNNAKARKALEAAGAFTNWADPKFTSTIQKTAVVDSGAVYVSTFDFTEKTMDGARGFVVKILDPREVTEIKKTFEADWNRRRINPVSANLAWAPKIVRMKISDLLRNTRYSLYIYTERIHDRVLVQEIGKAIKRGVAVKMLVSDENESANDPGIMRLRQMGARVNVLRKPKLMANMILADSGHKAEVALIGSVDLESSSLDTHRGLSVFISDKLRLKELKKIFKKDWKSSLHLKDKKLDHK